MPRTHLFVILFCCGFATTNLAEAATAATDHGVAVNADATLELAHLGHAVWADVVFPQPGLAADWLDAHGLQKDMTVAPGKTDRYGRVSITSDAEIGMLQDGVAVIYGPKETDAAWQAAEAGARTGKRGLWAAPNFILSADRATGHDQEFHLVEGAITHIYETKNALYLNFGEDWHTDFSITISGRMRRTLQPLLTQLHEGSRVRVRGTLYEENGPMIRVNGPGQLEIL